MAEVNEAFKIEDEELENVAGGAEIEHSYYCEKCKCVVNQRTIYKSEEGFKHWQCGGNITVMTAASGHL